MRVFVGATTIAACILLTGDAARADLRTVSRNSLVFIDSTIEGGEWAAYRLADERRPVIFRAEGPGRLVLRLRTGAAKDAKTAVAAVLEDDRFVLTARVDPVRDPEAKIVEGGGRPVSKSRMYVVRVPAGEHTVMIRWSEGGPLFVAAKYIEGRDPAAIAERTPDGDEVPLVEPPAAEAETLVQRIGQVPLGDADAGDAAEVPEGDPEEPADEAEPQPKKREDDPWNAKKKDPRTDRDSDVIATGPEYEPMPSEALRRRAMAPAVERKLTVAAPWFSWEVHAGMMLSRLGLDPGALLGVDARFPIPGLDSRAWTIGASLDAAYARGESRLLGETSRVPVGIAKLRHVSVTLGADVRWAFKRIEGVLDPYAALGGGLLLGSLSTDDGTISREEGTIGALALVRAGAAFGALGDRPFFELRFSGGRLFSDLARGEGSGAGYTQIDAVVGWRFELLTEAAAE